ncbi:hypothetical protein HHK36_006653 [Tetracentron sinense]|uniref:F-box domain-containing protein n=1 Tax=Tetracentron sinense TaxID=13715 RepID=A0A834ZHK9_TETSI|nr:hypothetical protein HHK36_006653 [Tetracentron sinense]
MKEMACLPHDLMIMILSRLSVKTLSKSRCVCKLWLQLISDPHLLHLHSHRSKQNPLLCFTSVPNLDTLHISCVDMEGKVIHRFEEERVRGLMEMFPSRFELTCVQVGFSIYVCNPTTLEFITLPEAPLSKCNFHISVGFGHISSTKEYKVVRIFCLHWESPPSDIGCEVLDLGSSSWRAVKDPHSMLIPLVQHSWIELTIEREGIYAILAFDIVTKEFGVVPYPEGCSDPRKINEYSGLVELGGLLCLAVAVRGKMDIWMLKDYKNHVWVKEYSINLNKMDPYDVKPWDFTARDIREGKILIESYEVGVFAESEREKGGLLWFSSLESEGERRGHPKSPLLSLSFHLYEQGGNDGFFQSFLASIRPLASKAVVNMISNLVNSTVPIAVEIFKKAGTYDEKKLFGVTTLDVVRAKTSFQSSSCTSFLVLLIKHPSTFRLV